MDLIAVMTYISLLAVVVVLTTIGSNANSSCNGPNVCNGCNGHTNSDGHNGWDGYNCYVTFLDIFGLSERLGTLTKKLISALCRMYVRSDLYIMYALRCYRI